MGKTIEIWFDFGSPASYLAWYQLPKIAAARGATIDWRPMAAMCRWSWSCWPSWMGPVPPPR